MKRILFVIHSLLIKPSKLGKIRITLLLLTSILIDEHRESNTSILRIYNNSQAREVKE
jgi:hypothetical protein